MCTVNNIVVDEMELRELLPELDSNAAIQLWIQKLVDLHIQQMRDMPNHDKTQEDLVYAMPDRDMTPEELYNAITDEIDYIYAKGWHEVHHQATGIGSQTSKPDAIPLSLQQDMKSKRP